MSGGNRWKGIRMYSLPCIGVARKWSFRSAVRKRAPFLASEITLLMMSFVSRIAAAGEPGSFPYDKRSPPTTIRTLYGSDLRGRKSQTKVAYVISTSFGTSDFLMKSLVSVLLVPLSLPWAKRPNSLLTPWSQTGLCWLLKRESIVSFLSVFAL